MQNRMSRSEANTRATDLKAGSNKRDNQGSLNERLNIRIHAPLMMEWTIVAEESNLGKVCDCLWTRKLFSTGAGILEIRYWGLSNSVENAQNGAESASQPAERSNEGGRAHGTFRDNECTWGHKRATKQSALFIEILNVKNFKTHPRGSRDVGPWPGVTGGGVPPEA